MNYIMERLKFLDEILNNAALLSTFIGLESCPTFVLERAIKKVRCFDIQNIVSHPNCPEHILNQFCDSIQKDFDTRQIKRAIANNKNCPPYILEKLNDIPELISTIAANRNCPIELLIKYSQSDDYILKSAVIRNPNTPYSMIFNLSQDKIGVVKYEAEKELTKRNENAGNRDN